MLDFEIKITSTNLFILIMAQNSWHRYEFIPKNVKSTGQIEKNRITRKNESCFDVTD